MEAQSWPTFFAPGFDIDVPSHRSRQVVVRSWTDVTSLALVHQPSLGTTACAEEILYHRRTKPTSGASHVRTTLRFGMRHCCACSSRLTVMTSRVEAAARERSVFFLPDVVVGRHVGKGRELA